MSNDRNFYLYRQLADLEEQRGAQQLRDRFLILAADAALSAGLHADADELRARLLETNPHHLLRPYHSFIEAMRSADVYSYIADLRSSYPPEEAEQLLASLGGKVPEEVHWPADPPPLSRPKPEAPDEPPHYEIEKPDPIPTPEEPAVLPLPPRTETKKSRKVTLASVAALAPIPEMPEQAPTYREPEPPPRPARRRPEPEEPSLLSVWVATALFVVVLTASVAFATYTLARPFLEF